jgi:hypothetical protein
MFVKFSKKRNRRDYSKNIDQNMLRISLKFQSRRNFRRESPFKGRLMVLKYTVKLNRRTFNIYMQHVLINYSDLDPRKKLIFAN